MAHFIAPKNATGSASIDTPAGRRGPSGVGFPSLARSAALGGAVLLGASCQLIHGLDEYDPISSTGAAATQSGGSGGADGGPGPDGAGAGPPPLECNGGDGVCLAEIPAGWAGYYFLYSTPLGEGAAQCSDGTTPVRSYADPSTAPPECAACNCGAPTILCDAPFEGTSFNACAADLMTVTLHESCALTGDNVNTVRTGQPVVGSATCVPSGGGAAQPLGAMWLNEHSLCKASVLAGGDCSNGDVCVDKAGMASICISKEGDSTACPDGWESAALLETYSDGDDERGCSPCACEPPLGNPCAGGNYLFFNGDGCEPPAAVTIPQNAGCTDVPTTFSARYAPPPNESECVKSGGAPAGSVIPGPSVTLCCR